MFGKFPASYACLLLLAAAELPAAAQKRPVVPAPCIVDNQATSEIDVGMADVDEEVTIDATQLLQALQGKVERSLLEELRSVATAGTIRIGDLRRAGLAAEFDREKLELQPNRAVPRHSSSSRPPGWRCW